MDLWKYDFKGVTLDGWGTQRLKPPNGRRFIVTAEAVTYHSCRVWGKACGACVRVNVRENETVLDSDRCCG